MFFRKRHRAAMASADMTAPAEVGCGAKSFSRHALAVLQALPARDRKDRAATDRIAQKQRRHLPIALVFDRIGHCRQMRAEKKGPGSERDRLRAALVLQRLRDLRDVGQEPKAVEDREHCKRGVCDCHAKAAA